MLCYNFCFIIRKKQLFNFLAQSFSYNFNKLQDLSLIYFLDMEPFNQLLVTLRKQYCCPISQSPMSDPIVTYEGISYQRLNYNQLRIMPNSNINVHVSLDAEMAANSGLKRLIHCIEVQVPKSLKMIKMLLKENQNLKSQLKKYQKKKPNEFQVKIQNQMIDENEIMLNFYQSRNYQSDKQVKKQNQGAQSIIQIIQQKGDINQYQNQILDQIIYKQNYQQSYYEPIIKAKNKQINALDLQIVKLKKLYQEKLIVVRSIAYEQRKQLKIKPVKLSIQSQKSKKIRQCWKKNFNQNLVKIDMKNFILNLRYRFNLQRLNQKLQRQIQKLKIFNQQKYQEKIQDQQQRLNKQKIWLASQKRIMNQIKAESKQINYPINKQNRLLKAKINTLNDKVDSLNKKLNYLQKQKDQQVPYYRNRINFLQKQIENQVPYYRNRLKNFVDISKFQIKFKNIQNQILINNRKNILNEAKKIISLSAIIINSYNSVLQITKYNQRKQKVFQSIYKIEKQIEAQIQLSCKSLSYEFHQNSCIQSNDQHILKSYYTKLKSFNKILNPIQTIKHFKIQSYCINVDDSSSNLESYKLGYQVNLRKLLTILQNKTCNLLQWKEIIQLNSEQDALDDKSWQILVQNSWKMPNLKYIDLQGNNITKISKEDLQKLKNIKLISLVSNPLTRDSNEVLTQFGRLNPQVKIFFSPIQNTNYLPIQINDQQK